MNRKELVAKLELTSRALAQSNIIPILQSFCFTGRQVIAYDDNLGIVSPCETKDQFTVNGKTLLGLLSNSHSEGVEFSIEEHDLIVKAGRSTFKLPYQPIEDYLFKEPDFKQVTKLTPIGKPFIDGLTACLLTASKDQTQHALMGVCLHSYKNNVALYSTDGDAISRFVINGKGASAPSLLPNSFCETVVKLAGTGTLTVSGEWARAAFKDGFVVYGRVIVPDTSIDYEDWIKKTIKGALQFDPMPKGFDAALSRARVVADPESAKTVLTVQAGRLKILTETASGVVRDTLAYAEQDEVEASVSAELMQRCASLTDELAILNNCCVFRSGEELFILTSNMGE
jgi:DNA polymerase III sliding clamp (beta) subunit (PCNA family)